MSLVDARSAGPPGDKVVSGAMVNLGVCTRRFALNAALNARCRLNLETIDLFIVVPATRK